MNLKINKSTFYQALFMLCVLAPYFNNYELTFLIWFVTAVFTIRKKYSSIFAVQIICFSSIFALAFFSSLFSDFKPYNFVRDITYLLKPILGLLIGYQLCKNHITNPLKTLVTTGAFLAFYHLILVVFSIVVIRVPDIHDLRYYAGYFSDFEIYALAMLLFSMHLKIDISQKKQIFYVLILLLSTFFYLSRTNFIQFFILYIGLKGFLVLNKKTVVILTTLFVTVALTYSAILYYNPKRNGAGIEAFLYKIKNAPIEPFKTKINKEDYKDFNDNYRSVENILTIKESRNIGYYKIFCGQGLGSTIDLQRDVELDGIMLRYIAILHNGFMTVFLKSGILGVTLLLFSIFMLLRAQSKVPENKHINYIIVGTVVFLVMSYWVFMGLYFKADTKSIIIGLLLAVIERNKLAAGQQNL